MADLSIDEAKARNWMADVKNEISAVEALLKKVNAANASTPSSEDTIMQGIEKVYTALDTSWTRMCNSFKEANSLIDRVIGELGKTVLSVVDDIESVRSKIDQ